MAEWNETKLDQELEAIMQEMPDGDELEMRISKRINRKIQNMVVRTVAVIGVLLVAGFFVISPLLNLVFFNPKKLNEEPDQILLGVMRDYAETTLPYREIMGIEVTNQGFGCYEIAMQAADLTEPLNIGPYNVWCEMNWGKYGTIKDADGNLTKHMNRFDSSYENPEEMLENIKELPKSAMIYLSVSDTEAKTLEELKSLPTQLEWIQIYQPNADFQGGLNMMPRARYDEDDVREDMSETELLQVYISNLKNLLEYKDAWAGLGLCDGGSTIYTDDIGVLTKTYEDAKMLDGIKSENYCVSGKRDEIVKFLEETTLDSMYVEHVRVW